MKEVLPRWSISVFGTVPKWKFPQLAVQFSLQNVAIVGVSLATVAKYTDVLDGAESWRVEQGSPMRLDHLDPLAVMIRRSVEKMADYA